MPRYQLKIAYNGRKYSGFQVQPNKTTVQSAIEKSIYKILGEKVRIIPSGRTDSGVHALEQVIHFDAKTKKALQRLKNNDFAYQLNSVLPTDIAINGFKFVKDNFHARNLSQKKSYTYQIINCRKKNPFLDQLAWKIPKTLNQPAMEQAASYLIGTHDFSSFCASDATVKTKIRTIHQIKFSNKKISPLLALKDEKYISIEFIGTGFLKQMVRSLVGTLVAVGHEKIKPDEIKQILKSKDRQKAHKTAPAHGLYLKKVWY